MRGCKEYADGVSPLSQGRELKYPGVYTALCSDSVAPLAGAGIEM